jgi:hypothetical protein
MEFEITSTIIYLRIKIQVIGIPLFFNYHKALGRLLEEVKRWPLKELL